MCRYNILFSILPFFSAEYKHFFQKTDFLQLLAQNGSSSAEKTAKTPGKCAEYCGLSALLFFFFAVSGKGRLFVREQDGHLLLSDSAESNQRSKREVFCYANKFRRWLLSDSTESNQRSK